MRRPRHPDSRTSQIAAELRRITNRMCSLYARKSRDYGNSLENPDLRRLGLEPWRAIIIRMSDKWHRLINLVGADRAPSVRDESIDDTLLDLSLYALLCHILRHSTTDSGERR